MKWIPILLVAIVLMQGCSVVMAAKGIKEPDMDVLRMGESRGRVEMEFGQPASVIEHPDGFTYATYAYMTGDKPSGGRAVAHGVMDVLTLGLWEIAGTPIEMAADAKDEHAVVVVYDDSGFVVGINQSPARREEED